jgi:hypothetical protein
MTRSVQIRLIQRAARRLSPLPVSVSTGPMTSAKGPEADIDIRRSKVRCSLESGHDSKAVPSQFVATKLRCLCLCKVEMSLGGIAGSVSRRRGDHHIGAAPASAESFRLRFGGFSDLQGAVL